MYPQPIESIEVFFDNISLIAEFPDKPIMSDDEIKAYGAKMVIALKVNDDPYHWHLNPCFYGIHASYGKKGGMFYFTTSSNPFRVFGLS